MSLHTDFEIQCGSRLLKVHKAIISSQGGFFEGLCKPAFIESQNSHVDLSSSNYDDLKAAIRHLYGFPYKSTYPTGSLLRHVSTYAAGDYFGLPSLKQGMH